MPRTQEEQFIPPHKAADRVKETMRDIIMAGRRVVLKQWARCPAEAYLVGRAADALIDEVRELHLDPQDFADLLAAAKDAIREP